MKKRIIYIDMDDTLCDFAGAFAKALTRCPELAYPQSQYGFFANLKPLPSAVDAFHTLTKSPENDVYILTAPSIYNPMSYAEKRVWVEQHLGFEYVDRLIICYHKHLLKGDILIDDCVFGKNSQDKFEGTLIHFGSAEVPDWKACLNEIDNKEV